VTTDVLEKDYAKILVELGSAAVPDAATKELQRRWRAAARMRKTLRGGAPRKP